MIKFQRLPHGKDLPLPAYATKGSAGMDICSAVDINISPGRFHAVATGFNVAIPDGFEMQVRPRSGLAAKYGVTVLNSPGTIDSDYRGEVKAILINHGPHTFRVNRGDRIAQLVVASTLNMNVQEVDELDETERGLGHFGSTGV